MKHFLTSCLLLLGLALSVSASEYLVPNFPLIEQAEAHRSGCHRWHTCPSDTGSYNMEYRSNGTPVQYCGSSMYMGTDGHCHYYSTPSSNYYSPTYSPTINTPPSCPLFSSYNTLSKSCTCYSGYYIKNNSCVSIDEICRDQYGYSARSTIGDKCTCGYGYRFNRAGNKCISNESYCQELDWNAEYDILKDSCVCKDGYKAGITGSSCVRDYDENPSYQRTYYPSSSSYSCPTHSSQDPLDPTNCPCDPGYTASSDKSACVLKKSTTPAFAPVSECGKNMHGNRGGCVCDVGYSLDSNNYSCTFKGCPAGYSLNSSGACDLKPSALGNSVACLTRSPCTCPSGYESMGNRKCIPK